MKIRLKTISEEDIKQAPAMIQLLHKYPDCIQYAEQRSIEAIRKEYIEYFELMDFHKRENQIYFFNQQIRPLIRAYEDILTIMTGKSKAAIYSWKSGRHVPPLDTIIQVAELIGVPM